MDTAYFQDLYRYNFWANRRVWACIEPLTDEQFIRNMGHSHGSLRVQCIHVMGVEWWWFRFLETGIVTFLDRGDYPTRAAVRAKWDEVEEIVIAYLETITAQDLEREVRPEVWEESRQPIKLWQALIQVVNHSTDHRAQMLASIHHLGGETVGQDYLHYLFEQQEVDARSG